MAKRRSSVVDGLKQRLDAGAAAVEAEVAQTPPVERATRKVSLAEVPVAALVPNPDNVRTTFDEKALAELAESFQDIGIVQPLVVRPATPEEKGDQAEVRYTILAGERRYRAALIAELAVVPVVVRLEDQPDSATVLMLIENLQREDLSPLEEALAFQRLTDTGLSQRTVATRVGMTQAHVSRRLSLLTLVGSLQKLVQVGELGVDVAAKELSRLSREDQEQVVEAMAERVGRGSTWANPEHVRAAVTFVRERQERAEREEKLKSEIVPGAKEITDIEVYSLSRSYERRLDDDTEIEQAAAEDRLAVVVQVGANRLDYYNTGSLPKAQAGPGEQAERDRMKRYRETADLVERWVVAHHTEAPKSGPLAERLAEWVVDSASMDQVKLVRRWVGGLYGEAEAEEFAWRTTLQDKDRPTIAWLVTVASDLSAVRYSPSQASVGGRRTAERVAQIQQEEQAEQEEQQ